MNCLQHAIKLTGALCLSVLTPLAAAQQHHGSGPRSSPESAPLPREVTLALARAGVPEQAISVVVQSLPNHTSAHPITATRSASLIRHRANTSVNPASLMKLVTTYAALDQLGADFTWKNRVYADGSVQSGVLNGNLIIRGSGDPKLVLERLDALFKQVQARGVREVRGDILLDRRVFDVPEKNPAAFDDEPLRPYNVAPDGLLVNFKSLIFTFSPDINSKRVLLRSEPPMARLELPQEINASYGPCGDWRSALQADFSSADRIAFAGRYPLACGERTWPVAYIAPRQFAARVIEAMWRTGGGQLSGTVREDSTPIHAPQLLSSDSLPLSEIIADINKFSNNVMAQQLFLTLSAQSPEYGGVGSFAASQKNIEAWWRKRLPHATTPILDNGSGLSRIERSSASALNALLQTAAASDHAHVFANSLAIAGLDGTVVRMRERNPHSPAIGQAQLKTGSLKDVAAIAGYVQAASGQRYSLVAIINHENASTARPALDALVEWVVKAR